MRNIVEAVLAVMILIVGGGAAMMLTGFMPEPVEAEARRIAGALGIIAAPADTALPPGGGGSGADGRNAFDGTTIMAAPVRVVSFVDHIRAIGTGQATESVTVATSVSGLVDEVHFTSSEMVAAGEPLVTLEREAEAIALQRARAEHAQAKAVNQRYQASGQRSSTFSRAQIEEVETALAVARAALGQEQFEYDRRVIRAPFAGRVGLEEIAIGQHLASGADIVRLDDMSALEVEFLVPEGDAANVAPATAIRAMSLAMPGRVFAGEIIATASHIDPATRTLRVRARIPNPDRALRPGTTFSIAIPVEGAAMPVVPALSVQWSRDGAFVWRIRDSGVERVSVTIVRRDGDDVFVEAGLDEGALVAVEGAHKLNAGSDVDVQANQGTDAPLTVEMPARFQPVLETARAGDPVQVTQ